MSRQGCAGSLQVTGRVISWPFVLAGGLLVSPFYVSAALLEASLAKEYEAAGMKVLDEQEFETQFADSLNQCPKEYSEKLLELKNVGILPKFSTPWWETKPNPDVTDAAQMRLNEDQHRSLLVALGNDRIRHEQYKKFNNMIYDILRVVSSTIQFPEHF